jgi:hypothetical protein
MFLKKDNFILGIILGFLAPMLGVVIFYFVKFSAFSFKDFLEVLVLWKSFFTAVITVSLIADAALFTIYINTDRDKTARGIFAATMVYTIICLVLKYAL